MSQKRFESFLESIPLRAYVREKMEVECLRAATGIGDIEAALHFACGNGDATKLILKHFSVKRMSGVDRDAESIAAATREHGGEGLAFTVQDSASLSFADNTFDAVFDLADLHNSREWRSGLKELQRVLKPGGLLILEELSKETFAYAAGKVFKALTDHPYEDMLSQGEFRDYALQIGFEILHFEEKTPFGLLKYFVMVGRKA